MATKKPSESIIPKARVLLDDDHPIVRQGLTRLINQEIDLMVCGEASTIGDGYETLSALKPDLIVVDLSLEDANGLELIKRSHEQFPKLRILVLSMHKESLYAERALRAGARGYIMKQESADKVLFAIRRVLKGEIYLSDSMGSEILQKLTSGGQSRVHSPVGLLSDRELEVFELLGRGGNSRQIADRLNLSIKTVETYREHIKEKLNLRNAAELMQHAFEWVKAEQLN